MTSVGRAFKCRKLTPRFVVFFEIIQKVEVVVYEIALLSSLSNLHDIFMCINRGSICMICCM